MKDNQGGVVLDAKEILEKRWSGPVKRPCGDCNACCEHFEIEEIHKSAKEMCPFLLNGGCGLYSDPTRPKTCAQYVCAWAMGYGEEEDRPDKSGVIIDYREGIAGWGLYGHLTREPVPDTLEILENISEEANLDIYLENK